jgi:hypothetical protein
MMVLMNEAILFGIVVSLPFIIAIVTRVNSALVITAVLMGDALTRFLGDDAALVLQPWIRSSLSGVVARVILLVLPLILVLIFTRNSTSRATLPLQLLPLATGCMMFGIFLLSLLPSDMQQILLQQSIIQQITQAIDVVVGSAVVFGLLVLLKTHHTKHGSKKSKKSHH